MNTLLKLLNIFQLYEITPNRVEYWIFSQNVEMLRFTLKKGLQNDRIHAIKGLRQVLGAEAIPFILPHFKDDIKMVALEAINEVTQIDRLGKYAVEVEKAKMYWEDKEKMLAAIVSLRDKISPTPPPSKLIDKSKMVQFNQLKERLKRPIRW